MPGCQWRSASCEKRMTIPAGAAAVLSKNLTPAAGVAPASRAKCLIPMVSRRVAWPLLETLVSFNAHRQP